MGETANVTVGSYLATRLQQVGLRHWTEAQQAPGLGRCGLHFSL
jgi:hypothetical protein